MDCKKKEKEEINQWSTFNFKKNYTIEVPPGFTGGIVKGFEGSTFSGTTENKRVRLSYSYCTLLYCFDFGDRLKYPFRDSIQIKDTTSQLITLNKVETFYQDYELIGILYYSNNDLAKGRLFWKEDNFFKQALEIDFYSSDYITVTKIINSIKRK